MKKSMLVLIMMVLTIGVYGQDKRDHVRPPKRDKAEMMERMKEHLSLSDAQVIKIQAIHDKYEDQQEVLHDQMGKLKEQHRALRESKRKEIDQVLTPEQRTKIKEMKAEHKGRRKNKRHMERAPKG